MKKVYISGQISGLPWSEVERKFTAAENAVIKSGCEPVSPLKNGLPANSHYQAHMAIDLDLLSSCDAVMVLPCWDYSPGAIRELKEAIRLQKEIWFMR